MNEDQLDQAEREEQWWLEYDEILAERDQLRATNAKLVEALKLAKENVNEG